MENNRPKEVELLREATSCYEKITKLEKSRPRRLKDSLAASVIAYFKASQALANNREEVADYYQQSASCHHRAINSKDQEKIAVYWSNAADHWDQAGDCLDQSLYSESEIVLDAARNQEIKEAYQGIVNSRKQRAKIYARIAEEKQQGNIDTTSYYRKLIGHYQDIERHEREIITPVHGITKERAQQDIKESLQSIEELRQQFIDRAKFHNRYRPGQRGL